MVPDTYFVLLLFVAPLYIGYSRTFGDSCALPLLLLLLLLALTGHGADRMGRLGPSLHQGFLGSHPEIVLDQGE